jgi:hypothetical protein
MIKKMADCTTTTNSVTINKSERISKAEKGKKFTLNAAMKFSADIVEIDNCIFKNSVEKRCDYLFLVKKNEKVNVDLSLIKSKAYYVELKGVEINKACEQLYNSIVNTKSGFNNFNIEAFIISTQGFQPKLKTTVYYKKLKKLIGKEANFRKVHKGNSFEHIENI